MNDRPLPRRRPTPVGQWLFITVMLLGGIGYVFRYTLLPDEHASEPVAAAPEAPMAVSVVMAEPRMIARTIVASGTLVARDEALVTARIDGHPVAEVLAEVGDRVEAGQPLARLDGRRIELQLAQKAAERAQAEAAVAQAAALLTEAEANASEAQRAADRASALRARDNVSAQALEEREAAAAMAAARVEAQHQGLAAAQSELLRVAAEADELVWERDQAVIRATAPGIVLERNAVLGQATPTDGTPLFRILEDGAVEMQAAVVETGLPAIRAGQTATVRVAGHDAPLEGIVRLVAPAIDPATRMGRVRIDLPEGRVRPGASATASFAADPHLAIVVPRSAVLAGDAGSRVQVVVDGAVVLRDVETGVADAGGVEIRSGLAKGEVVVATAGGFLREGSRVAPVAAVIARGDD